jgi:site-specific recombinase XerD
MRRSPCLLHSYAVELRKAGMNVAAISKLLGHSSIAITARCLDHLTNDVAGRQLVAIDLPELEV